MILYSSHKGNVSLDVKLYGTLKNPKKIWNCFKNIFNLWGWLHS